MNVREVVMDKFIHNETERQVLLKLFAEEEAREPSPKTGRPAI